MEKEEKPEKTPMTVSEMAAMGGRARKAALTKKQRSEIAKKAAGARWPDKKNGKDEK